MMIVAAELVPLMVVVAGADVLVTPSLQITSTISIAFSGYGKGFSVYASNLNKKI